MAIVKANALESFIAEKKGEGKPMGIAFWRDLSIIWLSLFCFIALVIPIAILYFAVRGMNALQGKVTPLIQTAQRYSRLARTQTEGLSAKVAEPVIQAHSRYTKLASWWQSVWAK